jgi:drug/metabolite transporter (DMT)-like permease
MKTNRRHAVAALIAAGLLWGTTVPLSKLALEWLSPGWLTAMRFGLAAAVLLAALLITGRRRGALRAAFTPAVLIAGAFGYGGSVMVQNAGITRTSVTHAALLIGAVPVLVAVIAAVWHRTVARPVAWFGFAVSLGGVGLVTAGGGGGGATLIGDGLVLASLLLSATVTVAQGRLLTGRDPVAVTAVQFLGAALGSLPVAALAEGAPAVPSGIGPVLAVVALALAGTLAPFTLFAFGQSRVSAEVAGAFLNLEPLVGAIAGAVVFGDPAGLAQVAGGVAILAGIALSSVPLLGGRRVERRALAMVAAAAVAGADSGTGVAAGAGVSMEAPGAVLVAPARLRPPEARIRECDLLPEREGRKAHSLNSGARRSGRNAGSARGRGLRGPDGPGRRRDGRGPGPGGPGWTAGAGRPGGRLRPPGRRQAGRRRGPETTTGGRGPGGSGPRVIGGPRRSWPGASTGRSAAGR